MYRQLLLHQQMKLEVQRLEQTKQKLEQSLKGLPKGSIYTRNGRYYHVYRIDGKQHMSSIKDPALLSGLQIRRCIEACLPRISIRLKNCEDFLKKDQLYDAHASFAQLPERYKHMEYREFWLSGDVNPEEWGAEVYEHNMWSIEKANQTAAGRIVRSKSEAFIGSTLEAVPLIYRYEQKLVLFGEVFYPDFIILLPNCRKVIIWEHFGMMDNPQYAAKALHKIEIYSKAGWILGENFFFTFETGDMPFSFLKAKEKLDEILASDKVAW